MYYCLSVYVLNTMYHLRSRKTNIEIPVQLTVPDDSTFLNQLSDTQINMSQPDDHESDTSSSDVDLDLLTQDSEEKFEDQTEQVPVATTSDAKNSATSQNLNSDIQAAINLQILEQLDRMSKRLDQMEKSTCKKTLDKSKIKKSKKPKSDVQNVQSTLPKTQVDLTQNTLPANL